MALNRAQQRWPNDFTTNLSPHAHELNSEGTACADDCPACRWVAELAEMLGVSNNGAK